MKISSEKTDLKKTYLAIATMLLAILCIDLYMVIIKFLGDEYIVEELGLQIAIKPFSYSSTIKAGITNFQSTRSLQNLGDIEDDNERLELFNENFKKCWD